MKLLRIQRRFRRWLLPAILCGTALPQPIAPVTVAGGLRHTRLYTIATGRVLNHVQRDDARAALKASLDLIAQRKGFIVDSKVDIVDDLPAIRSRLREHSVDVLILGIAEFLDLESSHLVVPVLTDARGSQANGGHPYRLLARPASGISSLADLRGKNILVYSRSADNAGVAWLEVALAREKLGRAASFFASLKLPEKPQACILPLFFGTVDACVVDDFDLEMAREMNPQLGQLRTIASSPPLIDSVMAMPIQPHPFLRELLDTMLTLHEDPRGRQMLMVFKSDRIVTLQPGDLDASRELWGAYSRLPAERKN